MENMVKLDKYFWNKKKVLLTGHTGFKGTWLLLLLLELGVEVWGYSNHYEKNSLFNFLIKEKSIFLNNNDWVHLEEDLLNRKKLQEVINKFQPDIVIHMAAQAIVRTSYIYPLETWNTNLLGSLNLLDAITLNNKNCAVVFVTTDKVYENEDNGRVFKEDDKLGGSDPYSASKAALEIAVSSWRKSFLQNTNSLVNLATARAGNVIGGGDYAKDRIVPDIIKALVNKQKILIRNPNSSRPWQHVLESLNGYLTLCENLYKNNKGFIDCFNFGPDEVNNRTVNELVKKINIYWPCDCYYEQKNDEPYEAKSIKLDISKSKKVLNWTPTWNFETTVLKTINWYKNYHSNGSRAYDLCMNDINHFMS